jgi:outer membrane biogenesis lipoprotein LolB
LTNTNLVTLTYKDWVINYEGIKSKGEESFPKYIELNKNEITLKIYIVDWKID